MKKKENKTVTVPQTGPKPSAKSNLKAGYGIFKDKMINKPSVWKDDLRPTKR